MFDTGISVGSFTRGDDGSGGAGRGAAVSDAGVFDAVVGDACVAGLSVFAARCRVVENIARATAVQTVCEIADIRLAAADDGGGDALVVMREIVCEVAAALRVSQQVARPLVETGMMLDRLPLTAVRFVCGGLDWARVRVLVSVLGQADDATIAAVEFEAVAAAERFGPRSLRMKLWRLWFEYDSDAASAAQKVAVTGARGMSVRKDAGGVSVLAATLTDVEGAEAEALVEEIVGTVCPQDPRSARQLRVDGLMALLHSEHALECQCDQGGLCPQYGVADLPDRRRGHLLQILIDVETLLGLSENPAVLADGTALPAEVARVVAEDAQWQGLLIELAHSDTARAAADAAAARHSAAQSDTAGKSDLAGKRAAARHAAAKSDPAGESESAEKTVATSRSSAVSLSSYLCKRIEIWFTLCRDRGGLGS